jgi:hypothetical protein
MMDDPRRARLNALAAYYREYVSQLRETPAADMATVKRFEEIASDLEFAATLVAWALREIMKCARLGIQPEEAA